MYVDQLENLVPHLKGNKPDDLMQACLGQMDRWPHLFRGSPLSGPVISMFERTNRMFIGARRVALPPAPEVEMTLLDALRSRSSAKTYGSEPMSLTQLGGLLSLAAGTGGDPLPERGRRRTYPSGGALYPVETYVLVRSVEGLDPGAYHYSAAEHRLDVINIKPVQWSSFFYEPNIDLSDQDRAAWHRASIAIVLTSFMRKSYFKYGDRGWKLMLLEAGHIGQNAYLVATALGLGICALGGFEQVPLTELLGLDGYSEMVIYPMLIGRR